LVSAFKLLTRAIFRFHWPTDRLHAALCWHHDRVTGASWIRHELIDTGRNKFFWCIGCVATWTASEFAAAAPLWGDTRTPEKGRTDAN
jgi:hypothetical protein